MNASDDEFLSHAYALIISGETVNSHKIIITAQNTMTKGQNPFGSTG